MHDPILGLVSGIYSAVDDPTRWPAFLDRLGKAIGAPAVALHAEDLRSGHGQVRAAIGLDPDYQRSYDEHYGGTNIWLLRGQSLFGQGRVVTGEMVLPDSDFARSEYLNDWLRPQGYHHGLGAILLKRRSHVSFLSALRPKGRGPFGSEVIELMSVLMPHLQQAFQLCQQLGTAEALAGTFADALDRIGRAVFLVDPTVRVVHMNVRAEGLVSARDGLSLDRGELRTGRPDDDSTLRRLVADAAKTSSGQGARAGGALNLRRPSGRRPFRVFVFPVAVGRLAPSGTRALALVTAIDPEWASIPDEGLLKNLLGLTLAEAKLVRLLAEGYTIHQISGQLGLRASTLRTRLKTIFEKTSTHRQVDLVRLVSSVAPDL